MLKHFNNIEELYGKAYVQMPNGLFRDLSDAIKSKNKTNIKQLSFSYTYMVTIAFLYKYAHFIDVDNGTYIQNGDIKQILGYGRSTKTIDKIIKKNGTLEQLGLIQTIKDYPVWVKYGEDKINDVYMREFITINTLDENEAKSFREIVKNKNYEVKKPVFLFEYKNDIGSLYNYENTHRITLSEYLTLVRDEDSDNVDFLLYAFFKYKCYGLKDNMKSMALYKIIFEIGIGRDTFYDRLNNLKEKGYLDVIHKGWRVAGDKYDSNIEANEYYFKGIS